VCALRQLRTVSLQRCRRREETFGSLARLLRDGTDQLLAENNDLVLLLLCRQLDLTLQRADQGVRLLSLLKLLLLSDLFDLALRSHESGSLHFTSDVAACMHVHRTGSMDLLPRAHGSCRRPRFRCCTRCCVDCSCHRSRKCPVSRSGARMTCPQNRESHSEMVQFQIFRLFYEADL
jgi:hypothetical protein